MVKSIDNETIDQFKIGGERRVFFIFRIFISKQRVKITIATSLAFKSDKIYLSYAYFYS